MRLIYIPVFIGLLVWLPPVPKLAVPQPLLAAPSTTISLHATQDTYTDINLATSNMNEGLLNIANSSGPPGEADASTKKIFLAFDLSSVSGPIKRATLRLSTLTCDGLVSVDEADITVYGVNNDVPWAEDTLTWATQPDSSTDVLAHLDAGTTAFDIAQTYTWTDDNQGAFSTWLELQRGANNHQATLMLVINNAEAVGMADIFFEDREGTGAAYGCTDALGGPVLQVSDTFGGYMIYLPLTEH